MTNSLTLTLEDSLMTTTPQWIDGVDHPDPQRIVTPPCPGRSLWLRDLCPHCLQFHRAITDCAARAANTTPWVLVDRDDPSSMIHRAYPPTGTVMADDHTTMTPMTVPWNPMGTIGTEDTTHDH